MTKFLIGALLALLMAAAAEAAPTWTIIANADCSGFGAAVTKTDQVVNCCTASKRGWCDFRNTHGTVFERLVYATAMGVCVGGSAAGAACASGSATCTGGGTCTAAYTAPGGDNVSATQLKKLQFGAGNFVWAICSPASVASSSTAFVPSLVRAASTTNPAKIMLFSSNGAAPAALAEVANTTNIVGDVINCMAYGY